MLQRTCMPEAQGRSPPDDAQHAECADPAAVKVHVDQVGAAGCDCDQLCIAHGTVADVEGLQRSHLGELQQDNLVDPRLHDSKAEERGVSGVGIPTCTAASCPKDASEMLSAFRVDREPSTHS